MTDFDALIQEVIDAARDVQAESGGLDPDYRRAAEERLEEARKALQRAWSKSLS